jgi:DNA-binding XRE family transcriptional regulator
MARIKIDYRGLQDNCRLSNQEFADMIGMTKQSYSNLKARGNTSLRTWKKLVDVFGKEFIKKYEGVRK